MAAASAGGLYHHAPAVYAAAPIAYKAVYAPAPVIKTYAVAAPVVKAVPVAPVYKTVYAPAPVYKTVYAPAPVIKTVYAPAPVIKTVAVAPVYKAAPVSWILVGFVIDVTESEGSFCNFLTYNSRSLSLLPSMPAATTMATTTIEQF